MLRGHKTLLQKGLHQLLPKLPRFPKNSTGLYFWGTQSEWATKITPSPKEQYQYPILIDIAKLKGAWYSDGSDYSMVKRDANSYFTSSRFIKNEKVHLNRVYTITGKDGEPAVLKFKSDVNERPGD